MENNIGKYIAYLAIILGFIGTLVSISSFMDVYDANQQLAAMNNMMGGLIGKMGGQAGSVSYARPIVYLIVSFSMLAGGGFYLKKAI